MGAGPRRACGQKGEGLEGGARWARWEGPGGRKAGPCGVGGRGNRGWGLVGGSQGAGAGGRWVGPLAGGAWGPAQESPGVRGGPGVGGEVPEPGALALVEVSAALPEAWRLELGPGDTSRGNLPVQKGTRTLPSAGSPGGGAGTAAGGGGRGWARVGGPGSRRLAGSPREIASVRSLPDGRGRHVQIGHLPKTSCAVLCTSLLSQRQTWPLPVS